MHTVEWTEPDAQGMQRCPRHPDVDPFRQGGAGCWQCAASPVEADDSVPGEGEAAKLAADRRGLPDALGVEDRMWNMWAFAQRRAERAARIAEVLSTPPEDGEPESPYGFDLDLAVRFEAAAAKWADVATKSGKIATGPVLHRERMSELERRARLMKGKGN